MQHREQTAVYAFTALQKNIRNTALFVFRKSNRNIEICSFCFTKKQEKQEKSYSVYRFSKHNSFINCVQLIYQIIFYYRYKLQTLVIK